MSFINYVYEALLDKVCIFDYASRDGPMHNHYGDYIHFYLGTRQWRNGRPLFYLSIIIYLFRHDVLTIGESDLMMT